MSHQSIDIRIATIDDLPAVQSCAKKAYEKYISIIGKKPAPMTTDLAKQITERLVYVAISQDAVAGYVVFYPDANTMHLESVAVVPKFAGQGIGKKLIHLVEQQAKDTGKHSVELYTNEAMAENLTIYPKLGYTEVHRQAQMGFNRVFFQKLL